MTADIAERKLKSRVDHAQRRPAERANATARVSGRSYSTLYLRYIIVIYFYRRSSRSSLGNGATARFWDTNECGFRDYRKKQCERSEFSLSSSFERASFPAETLFPRRNLSRSTRSIFRSHPLARSLASDFPRWFPATYSPERNVGGRGVCNVMQPPTSIGNSRRGGIGARNTELLKDPPEKRRNTRIPKACSM